MAGRLFAGGKGRASKAQMEIIGLIIIVIMVITALMLYMVYKINNPSVTVKQGYVNKELASNFLITVTKVNIRECPHHTLSDLVTDCANTLRRRIYCGGESSCVVANRTFFEILSPAMDELGKDFAFTVSDTEIDSTGACDNKEKVQATQVLPLLPGFGHVTLTLDVCEMG